MIKKLPDGKMYNFFIDDNIFFFDEIRSAIFYTFSI